jgi:ABC-type Zn uptake system ZnuABC Zn-binding protein ZnuA
MKWIAFVLALSCLGLLLAGCSNPAQASTQGKINVVTDVSPITSIVYNIGGERINLTGIIPEGSDSHTYEPVPSDARALAQADVVFLNGLNLNPFIFKLAQANLKKGASIIQLGNETITPSQYIYDFSFPKSGGSPNPHLWMNPIYALHYAEIVKDKLSQLDPANATYYQDNYNAYQPRIMALDQAIQTSVDSIPPANRKLLTYHDSFPYFALRYGMTVIGAIQPSNFSEPSAREVAQLIQQIEQVKVPAIFGSEVFPSPVLKQIGQETGAVYVDTLRDDTLPGNPGDPNHTYIGLMVFDVATMTKALGGNPVPVQKIDPSNLPGLSQGTP